MRTEFESLVDEFNTPFEKRAHHLVGKTYSTDRMVIELAFCETKTIALYSGQEVLYDESPMQALTD